MFNNGVESGHVGGLSRFRRLVVWFILGSVCHTVLKMAGYQADIFS